MNKNEPTVIPMNSHFVKFDPPKMGVIEGFVEEVHGMTLSDYCILEENGRRSFETMRTILIGEELDPCWHFDSYNCNIDIHFLKDFPKLTLLDIKKSLQLANGTRSYSEMFEDFERHGCTTELKEKLIKARLVNDGKYYSFRISELGNITVEKTWIPDALAKLYSLQSFLKCRFHISSKDYGQTMLDLINELLENHAQYGVKVANFGGEDIVYNDGINSYYKNGVKEPMSREEFLAKYDKILNAED